MVRHDSWDLPVFSPNHCPFYYIDPLEPEYPDREDLEPDALRSVRARIAWGGIMTLYLLFALCFFSRSNTSFEDWAISLLLILGGGLPLSVFITTTLAYFKERKELNKLYAQRRRSAAREASCRSRYALKTLRALERKSGLAHGRFFRMQRTMTKLNEHYERKAHLSFEREYRQLLESYLNDARQFGAILELEDEYEELLRGRNHNFPEPPELPIWEIKQMKLHFGTLIDQIDGNAAFATIIIILKASDRNLDPAVMLKKLKRRRRA